MAINFNIKELFQENFGINTPLFKPTTGSTQKSPVLNYSGIEYVDDNADFQSSNWMGKYMMFPARFKGGNYQYFKPNGQISNKRLGDFEIPPATLFSFRRAKNIIRTQLNGGSGSVKEIFGFDDWIIDVKGFCLDEPNSKATDQLEQLLQWESLADVIEVSGQQFAFRDITRVTINDWKDEIPQGKAGMFAFSCQLIADEFIEGAMQKRISQ